ncbi:MAG: DUF2490 domain-containing protein [Candidatus Omnitrophica bacterium]|nr:DUF2490 domain-containing protein [Candidatus Omnitrophota bacterium]
MIRQLKIIFLGFILIGTMSVLAHASGDVKYFSTYTFSCEINDDFSIFFQPEGRMYDDLNVFSYYHFRLGGIYEASKNLKYGLTYRFARSRSLADVWSSENRIELDLTPKFTIGNFKISDRSRFEYRMLHSRQDKWRYRNNLTLSTTANIGKHSFSPYVSNEIYIDFDNNVFNTNWSTAGFSKKLSDKVSLNVFYRLESIRIKHNEWDTNNIFGTNLTLKL